MAWLGAAWAAALALGTLARAWTDVATTWDVFYYHLPFAARLWGIVPREAYAFTGANDARFAGLPLLVEALMGLAWKVAGKPEAANLVAWSSVLAYALTLRRALGVPLAAGTLAALAVPLVQTHATSCYVDLPAGVAAALAVLLAADAIARGGPPTRGRCAAVLVAAGFAANARLQAAPFAALALGALAGQAFAARGARGAAGVLAWAPLVFATPLRNLVVFGNPVWPMQLGGLPFAEEGYRFAPPWLAGAPQPLRFVASVLELGVRPLDDPRRWTVDQWMPSESTGSRLGGFFHVYVVGLLAALAALAAARRDRRAAAFAGAVLAATIVVAPLPQSHELRYYLAWMLVLVGATHALAGPRARTAILALTIAASAAVVASTRAAYVRPSGYGMAALVRDKVDPALHARIRDGERVCFYREPWTMLYASTFHPGRSYALREGESAEACGDFRFLP